MSRAPAVAGVLGATGRGIADLTRWLVSLFSRSLQVRIVVLTVVLTLVAIFGVGTYMTQVIARGLFESKLSVVSDQTNTYVGQIESVASEEDLGEALTVQLQEHVLAFAITPAIDQPRTARCERQRAAGHRARHRAGLPPRRGAPRGLPPAGLGLRRGSAALHLDQPRGER